MMNDERHIRAFDWIRMIACIMVLLIHVSAQYTDRAAQEGGIGLYVCLGCNMFAFTSLALFVMISGALYLMPAGVRGVSAGCSTSSPKMPGKTGLSSVTAGPSIRHMVRKSIHFLLLYAFWKMFYLLEDCVINPELLAQEGFKKHVILAFFQLPGKYHLWYLPMLALLLLLVPLLWAGCQRQKTCELYLILFFILAIIPQTAFCFEFPFKYLLMDFRNLFDLSYYTGYLGYFILGHYLYELAAGRFEIGTNNAARGNKSVWKIVSKKTTRHVILLWILAAAFLLTGIFYACRRSFSDQAAYYGFSTPFSLHCLLFATAIFLTVLHAAAAPLPDKRRHAFLSTCSGATFGIYLLHPFVLDILKKTRILPDFLWENPLAGIPILMAVLGLTTFMLAIVIIHIPVLKRTIS